MSVSDPSALLAHWNANVAPLSPSASAMPSVDAVSVSPAWASPLMAGAPVARVFGRGATVAVAALFSSSSWPASSVKLARTLIAAPTSASRSV